MNFYSILKRFRFARRTRRGRAVRRHSFAPHICATERLEDRVVLTALTIRISDALINESDGISATTATVSRDSDTAAALTVRLSSSDPSEVTVPSTVTIPVGRTTSLPFNVSSVNDSIVDGTQTVTITASASDRATDRRTIDVLDDDEPPALTIRIAAASINESDGAGAATATVIRNSSTANALTVRLSTSDSSELMTPATVTIPAGRTTSAPVRLDAVDDSVSDRTQTVTVTASATNHATGRDSVDVLDDETPNVTGPTGTELPRRPEISWTRVNEAASYELWVSHRTGGVKEFIRASGLTETSFVPEQDLPNGAFRVWVQATLTDGTNTPWSDQHDFHIGSPIPAAPQLNGPSGVLDTRRPEFSWNQVESAEYFDLWVNNRSTGQRQIVREQRLEESTFSVAADLPDGMYRAWLRAGNETGNGRWSRSIDFVIGRPVPGTIQLTSPDTTSQVSLRPTIAWTADSDALFYDLWVNNWSTGERQVIREEAWEGTTYTPQTDLTDGIHRMWVRAYNDTGRGPWSELREIAVGNTVPARAQIIAPQGDVSSLPEFVWHAAAGAESYEIQVNNQTTNEARVIVENGITTTRWRPESELIPAQYIIWVRAVNASGPGVWSRGMEFQVTEFSDGNALARLDAAFATGLLGMHN